MSQLSELSYQKSLPPGYPRQLFTTVSNLQSDFHSGISGGRYRRIPLTGAKMLNRSLPVHFKKPKLHRLLPK
jgi:hypothetical protein